MRRLTTDMVPKKVGQKIFREWCAEHGTVVDALMAADLVLRIAAAIELERTICSLAHTEWSPQWEL